MHETACFLAHRHVCFSIKLIYFLEMRKILYEKGGEFGTNITGNGLTGVSPT